MTLRTRSGWLVVATMATVGGGCQRDRLSERPSPTRGAVDVSPRAVPYEPWARREFYRRHPGQKPLNWDIATAAAAFHRSQPMGPFKLAVGTETGGNDCSDFVACCVDEGLGVGARFNRDSEQHLLGEDPRIFRIFIWSPGMPVQPGDLLSIRHSPWYQPYEDACWHCGVVGSDGRIYDFTKLRRWRAARYGRHGFEEFIVHSRAPGEVIVHRLRAAYRYRIRPLPPARHQPTA